MSDLFVGLGPWLGPIVVCGALFIGLCCYCLGYLSGLTSARSLYHPRPR